GSAFARPALGQLPHLAEDAVRRVQSFNQNQSTESRMSNPSSPLPTDQADSALPTKSAPAFLNSLPSGESDPSVMPGSAGAGAVQGEVVAWRVRSAGGGYFFRYSRPTDLWPG